MFKGLRKLGKLSRLRGIGNRERERVWERKVEKGKGRETRVSVWLWISVYD